MEIGGYLFAALLAYLALSRLADHGEFSAAAWRPFAQWGVWKLFVKGLGNNLRAAAVGMLMSLVIGTVIGLALLARRRTVRWPARLATELFRSVPLLLLLFFLSLALPSWGVRLADFWILVIALTIYNSAMVAEIVRAGMRAVPVGQSEAGAALGFSARATVQLIVLPQAFRSMSPALVSQMVILLKGTAFAFVLGGYIELLHSTTIFSQYYTRSELQANAVAGIMFMIVNLLLSGLAAAIERREQRHYGLEPAEPSAHEAVGEVAAVAR